MPTEEDDYEEDRTQIGDVIARSRERQYGTQSLPAVCMASRSDILTSYPSSSAPATPAAEDDSDGGWGQVFLFGIVIAVVLKLLAGH